MKRLLLFLYFVSTVAQSQTFITESGYVNFLSKASLNEFNGESDQLKGLIDLSQNLLDFYIDLNTLQTGIGLRDKHMRDNYLETDKYPFAEFTGNLSVIPTLISGTKTPVTAIGNFKIHGVEREIEVQGTLSKNADGYLELEGGFDVFLSDYNIEIPKLVFYELAEKQEVTFNAVFKPKK
ncbi:YceI family protein [Algoriphagus winogradskyi]|uniref:Polyisoprenoid-binding protein YceI n=1 Tax=Algoriphagus winogradskyi TaxID=237017 RepID=A0ABY1P4N0_9BACT|nr:YceI family protein [Algoriphagus winogradskyi]SMP25464.1 Polyisoprenoid-binding protein YceI [Algoriphagus winogradskyi]